MARGKGARRCAALLFSFLALVLVLSPARAVAESITVRYEGVGFADGPSALQVRRLVQAMVDGRSLRFDRCEVTLTGSPTVCTVLFSMTNLRPSGDPTRHRLDAVSGRLPLGNVRMLLGGKARWPEALVVKDLVVEVDSPRLGALLEASVGIRRLRGLAPSGTAPTTLQAGRTPDERARSVKRCLAAGLSLEGGSTLTLRNLGGEGLLHASGTLPDVLGERAVEVVGVPLAAPGGRLGFRARLLAVDGRVQDRCPEDYLAEGAVAAALQAVQDELDQALVGRSFLDEALVSAAGGLVAKGMFLLGTLEQVDRMERPEQGGLRPRTPTLDLNVYR